MAKQIKKEALRRTLRLIGPDVAGEKKLVAGGVVALLFEVVFRVLEPWPLKIVVDALSVSMGATIGQQPASIQLLIICGIALVLVVAMRALCNYLATVAFTLVGSRVSASLRARIFHHVQGLSQQFHARNRSADTVQRLVSDVARMQEVAVTAGLPLLANLITLMAMLIVMVVLDPVLSLVVVVAMVLFLMTSSGTSQKIAAAARKTRTAEGQLANTAQETLSSIKIVQAYGLESHLAKRFTGANKHSLKEGIVSRRLAARLERSTDVIVGIASAAVLIGGGLRVLEGAMTLGDLVLFTTYLRTTMKPLRDMAKYTGRIARATASGERVADLMDLQSEITSPNPAQPLSPAIRGEITFRNISTSYDGHPVLRGLDVTIHPGETTAIIGPSGAGKSTLVSLLIRAIDPDAGYVAIDGFDLTTLDLKELRSRVSLLHQEAVLFTGTIKENIRYGRFDATDAEIKAAAIAANAHDFIMALPDGYDTVVGERGGTLSGGQRQRVAIARALLRDTPIVVLDEATTGLDPHAASQVLSAIETLVEGRTTLAVTHDAEVALRADRVLWLQDGRVLLDGSPSELRATSDTFRAWISANSNTSHDVRIGESS